MIGAAELRLYQLMQAIEAYAGRMPMAATWR
jgi:hypothetical protein